MISLVRDVVVQDAPDAAQAPPRLGALNFVHESFAYPAEHGTVRSGTAAPGPARHRLRGRAR